MADETIKTMEGFHCEMFEMSLRLPEGSIDRDAFFEAADVQDKEEFTDEDGDFLLPLTFNDHAPNIDYHVHMRVLFFKDGRNKIDIKYHQSKPRGTEENPPYAEECARWFGSFLKVDSPTARISAGYLFDKSFSPVVSLPFPLISSEKALAGSLVTGLSILFPKATPESVIIQTDNGDTSLFFSTKSEVNLKEFDLITELEKLSSRVNSLLKKQEK